MCFISLSFAVPFASLYTWFSSLFSSKYNLAAISFTCFSLALSRSTQEFHSGLALSDSELATGMEELTFEHADAFRAQHNTITFTPAGGSLEKLAVAFALAQAVKLNVFEARVEDGIQRHEGLARSLARTGG